MAACKSSILRSIKHPAPQPSTSRKPLAHPATPICAPHVQVTRFNIYSDFRPFFEDPSNRNKVYRVNTTKLEVEEQHAIVLVG